MFEKRKKEHLHKQAAHKIVAADRLRRAGDLQESEAAAREAIEIDPQNQAPALACLGAVLSDQGRAEEAFGAYEQSLSQHADQPLVYTALAHMCLERGKPEAFSELSLAFGVWRLAFGVWRLVFSVWCLA
ncbi:MAG: tetratricopeptide repeat protein, partial [Alphaproteobacteria bacterium]|nr:tetratricopeptide repeat protein [Alphaproteobacteria bacterium]